MISEQIAVPQGHYLLICRDANGIEKWIEEFDNLVVNEGRTNILEEYFRTGVASPTWYMGFKSALTGQAAGDTLASHAGWTEVFPQGSNRVTLTFSAASAQSISTGQFNVTVTLAGPTNVGGALVCNVQTGSAGKLYSVGDFSQLRSVVTSDIIQVTETFNA